MARNSQFLFLGSLSSPHLIYLSYQTLILLGYNTQCSTARGLPMPETPRQPALPWLCGITHTIPPRKPLQNLAKPAPLAIPKAPPTVSVCCYPLPGCSLLFFRAVSKKKLFQCLCAMSCHLKNPIIIPNIISLWNTRWVRCSLLCVSCAWGSEPWNLQAIRTSCDSTKKLIIMFNTSSLYF